MPKSYKAIYPGTFDPFTLGHLNIVERGLKVFDHITIACHAGASRKSNLFTIEKRLATLAKIFAGNDRVSIDRFQGLLVNYLDQKACHTILRGIRTVEDFEFEIQMNNANRALNDRVETLFMLTEGRFSHISSSLIREIVSLSSIDKLRASGQQLEALQQMVPQAVIHAIAEKQ